MKGEAVTYGKSKQEGKCGAAGSGERTAPYLENRNLRKTVRF